MKSHPFLTILSMLITSMACAMHNQPPDLMPEQALKIIKMLKSSDKTQHPDLIAIIGESGSGKSTICARIIQEIDAAPLLCDGYHLTKSYGACDDPQAIRKSVLEDLILPTIAEAQQAGKSRAVFIIPAFELLYHNQNKDPRNQNKDNPIRCLLRALNPANFTNLELPLLIITETLPLKIPPKADPVEGENVIHIQPPTLEQRRMLIQYWIKQRQYVCDQTTQEEIAVSTEGKTITTIACFLSSRCNIKARQSANDDDTESDPRPSSRIIIRPALPSSSLSKTEFEKMRKTNRLLAGVPVSPPPEEETKCCCIIS
jgi:hypothetical protein